MANRSGGTTVTVVVACDAEASREHAAASLAAARDVVVRAAVPTGTMTTTVSRLRPDALVLITPRLRHVDVARLRAVARARGMAIPVVALVVDDPERDAGPAVRAGVVAVWPSTIEPEGLPAAVRALVGAGGSCGLAVGSPRRIDAAAVLTAPVAPARR